MLSYIKNYLKKFETNKNVHWTDEILEPLGKEIAERLSCDYFVGIPSAFDAHANMYFKNEENYIGRITIIPKDLQKGILYYNTGAKKDYSIQNDVNGFNNITAELPQDLDEIIKIVLNSK